MKKGKLGFTLVELLVVIALIAIMAAVAVPLVTHYVDDANTKSDKVFFEAVDSATFTGINQLKKAGKQVTIANVVNEVYDTYNGQYNEADPVNGTIKGEAPYYILPHAIGSGPSDGNYITIQLVKIKSGDTLMGNGYVVRLYKKNALVQGLESYTLVKGLALPEGTPEFNINPTTTP